MERFTRGRAIPGEPEQSPHPLSPAAFYCRIQSLSLGIDPRFRDLPLLLRSSGASSFAIAVRDGRRQFVDMVLFGLAFSKAISHQQGFQYLDRH
jgi:hypothetical protein